MSDYGVAEEARAIGKEAERETARESLERQQKVIEQVRTYLKGEKSVEDAVNSLIFDVYGGQEVKQVQITNLTKQFAENVILGLYPNPEYQALIYARTNDEKISLLRHFKETTDLAELEEIGRVLRDAKLLSTETWNETMIAED